MSTRTRVRVNHAQLHREVSLVAAPQLRARAAAALVIARRLAEEHRVTGAYIESLTVDGTRLGSTDPAADIIEHGSSDTDPQAILRRAAQRVGAVVIDRG